MAQLFNKIFLFGVICSLAPFKASTQDTLVLNDGTEVYAKVLEVGENTISYKLRNNLDGPTYTVNIGKIFMAIYKDGKRDIFKTQSNAVAARPDGTDTKSTFALSNATYEIKLAEIKNVPDKKNKAITLTGSADIFNNNKLFTTVSFTLYQRKGETLNYTNPNINYLNKSFISIYITSDKLKNYLFERYESANGLGIGWALPPNFFATDKTECTVAFLHPKATNQEIMVFKGKAFTKYNLQNCTSIESKILSIILLWLSVNFNSS